MSGESSSRRDFLFKTSVAAGGLLIVRNPANAEVFFDIERYGDKELKIATVNKLKQLLRNSMVKNPALAPAYLKLAINDALGFDIQSGKGGLDGSIKFEEGRGENKDLQSAIGTLKQIKQQIQRTNEMTLGDIVAFAGAEAIESVSGPRISVQLGREEAKGANGPQDGDLLNWDEPASVLQAFEKSGLGPREVMLLLSSIGELERLVKNLKPSLSLSSSSSSSSSDDDDDDDYETELFGGPSADELDIPRSFGAPDAMFGAKIGTEKFSNKYVVDLLKNKNKASLIGKIILENEASASFAQKYSSSNQNYIKDVDEAYRKMTLLGAKYTNRNS
eukprot:CAMPEP_0113942052 /NCGR_PEP_ID=MMETSP1339-20121228/7828_1 /TAXON_ID=94617 /ORGANISM="Fibrocapsa japonica" /LENGTH=332 /DNA_ID=CAMNT_0000946361 /DNA_START=171 /DNA_END=1169 /DNA_ORIENTATION=+ /assembly_acc=CAM_ASM_000762